MKFENIPHNRRKEICHTSAMCEVIANKDDLNYNRITMALNCVSCPGAVATPTGSLELLNLIINSTLSCTGARFAFFDINFFNLDNPMDRSEYAGIKMSVIPQEIIDEYNLLDYEHNGWLYFEIVRVCYGLPQYGRLANDLLCKRLNGKVYFQASTTPGLWRHNWRPIQFMLIVDDFGVEYVSRKHAEHLAPVLKKYHEISEDWESKTFAGIYLIWDYTQKHSPILGQFLKLFCLPNPLISHGTF